MLKGIHLTLMIGPVVPVPALSVVMEALTEVQVTNSADRNGFQLTMSVSGNSPIITTMLPAGYFDPIITRVIIIATLNGFPNVLIDGLVTNHEMSPSNEPGKSNLTITGEDIGLAMDLIQIIAPFPAMPEVAKINLLLAPFAFLGIIPLVIPPIVSTLTIPVNRWDSIIGQTPRQFIKTLANDCGYTFFIQSGPIPRQNIAYFGPDVNLPIPQSALTINMDAHSNVETMSFSMNGLAKKIKIYTVLDPVTKKITIPVVVPNFNILKPPMGLRPTPILKTEFADDVAKLSTDKIAQKVIGDLMSTSKNPAATSVSGSFDVLRYNGILRARMMVGVRGAGITYDGMYYVDSVTHSIKQGEYKQNFTLSRDGLISNTPVVVV